MYQIKRSSADDLDTPKISHQSLARPNRHFAQFVIDYVSMALYFDCWYPFLSNAAPAPFRKVCTLVSYLVCIKCSWIIYFTTFVLCLSFQSVPEEVSKGIAHNREILLNICCAIDRKATYRLMATNGELSWKTQTLKQLFTAITNYKNKMGKGILSSFQYYDQVSPVIQPDLYKSYSVYSSFYKFCYQELC